MPPLRASLTVLLLLAALLSSSRALPHPSRRRTCRALKFANPEWQQNYFEPSLLPPAQQNRTVENWERAILPISAQGFRCGRLLPNSTTHRLSCRDSGFGFEPVGKRPKAVIVFLHGLSLGERHVLYLPILTRVFSLNPRLFRRIRLEFPAAPFRTVTVDPRGARGAIQRAWADLLEVQEEYTIESLLKFPVDRIGLFRSALYINQVVARQKCRYDIDPEKVMLFGHSMGAIMAIEMVLSSSIPFAGVLSMSGSVLRAPELILNTTNAFSTATRPYKLTMTHGTNDTTVPYQAGVLSSVFLKPIVESTNGSFEFVTFEGLGHFARLFNAEAPYLAIVKSVAQTFPFFL